MASLCCGKIGLPASARGTCVGDSSTLPDQKRGELNHGHKVSVECREETFSLAAGQRDIEDTGVIRRTPKASKGKARAW